MHVFNRLRFVLVALMLLLAIASMALPRMLRAQEEAVDRTTRHDIAWTGANGRFDYTEFARSILTFTEHATPANLESATLAFEVFQSRLETWNSGEFGGFIRQSDERMRVFNALKDAVPKLESAFQSIETHESRHQLADIVTALESGVERIARDAFIATNNEISENRIALRALQNIQRILIIALIATGFLLIGLLTIQNLFLRKAHKAQRAIAQENAFLAAHDRLTGLPNRATLHLALEQACASTLAGPAVLMLDLDGFKPINDVLGHKAGDLLLISVAHSLEAALSSWPGAVAARFGGDEFVLLLPHAETGEKANDLAHDILASLRQPHSIDQHAISIDASIGIAIDRGDGIGPDELINRADIALNHAKASGKGTTCLYDPKMSAGIAERQRMEADLASSDPWDEFEPYYQPLVDLPSGRIIAVEALARWRHPERGLISPAEFIPIAESSGRIVEIGRIMLEKACRDAMLFPVPIAVSVNLSTVQLIRADVPGLIHDVLHRTALPPARLKLEITESVMIHDAKATHDFVTRLKTMGVTVSLDDFGTGYSSLSYLRRFAFDELKIDRSFVLGIQQDTQALAIIQTIVALARNLDMKVIAEGIETEEQARLISAAGCARGQGYLFGKPMPVAALMRALAGVPHAQVA
jgi:diguanylate cyclase (GGDEF)-like protein